MRSGVRDLGGKAELHGFWPVKDSQRHGRASSQFYNWFGTQMHLSAMVLGGIGIAAGLSLWGTVTAIFAGNILGAAATATCASMGPRRGLPQMVISRLPFGRRGNYLPAVLTTLLYLGWAAVGIAVNGQAMTQLMSFNRIGAVVIMAAVALAMALYGYRWIHAFNRVLTVASAIVFIILTIIIVSRLSGIAISIPASSSNQIQLWLVEFTVAFSFTLSWSSYAADYSRYLPKTVPAKRIFVLTFAALLIAATWTMCLGALVTGMAKTASIPALQTIAGVFAPVAFIILILSQLISVVLNIYSGSLATLSWDLPGPRWLIAGVLGVVAAVLAAVLGGPQFLSNYKEFLELIAYFVTPWFAILLIDIYWIHRRSGSMPAAEAFYATRGPLDGIRWPALGCFVVSIACSVPFMATALYTGPVGAALDGDISYFVSFVIAGVLYYVIAEVLGYGGKSRSAAGGRQRAAAAHHG